MDVSENNCTPKSSNLIRLSIINYPFWGTPIFGKETSIFLWVLTLFQRVGAHFLWYFFFLHVGSCNAGRFAEFWSVGVFLSVNNKNGPSVVGCCKKNEKKTKRDDIWDDTISFDRNGANFCLTWNHKPEWNFTNVSEMPHVLLFARGPCCPRQRSNEVV